MTLASLVSAEIVGLHDFFVAWFTGAGPGDPDTFEREFSNRFHPDAVLIPPAGTLLRIDQLAERIRAGYGASPDFRIAIRAVRPRRHTDALVVATYEEWQRNARFSQPPDNGRIATVVFERRPDRASGLRWLHIHETWLPDEVMAAGPYDF